MFSITHNNKKWKKKKKVEQCKESSTDEWVSEMLPVSIQWSISSSIKRNEVYIDRCSNMDEP